MGGAVGVASMAAMVSRPSQAEAMHSKATSTLPAKENLGTSELADALTSERAKLMNATGLIATWPDDKTKRGNVGTVIYVQVGGKVYGLTAAHNLKQVTGDADGVIPGKGYLVYHQFPGLTVEVDKPNTNHEKNYVQVAEVDGAVVERGKDKALVSLGDMAYDPGLLSRAIDGNQMFTGKFKPGTLAASSGINSLIDRPLPDTVVSAGRIFFHSQKRWLDAWMANAQTQAKNPCFEETSGEVFVSKGGKFSGPLSWYISKGYGSQVGNAPPDVLAAWDDVAKQVPKQLMDKVNPNIWCLTTPDDTNPLRPMASKLN